MRTESAYRGTVEGQVPSRLKKILLVVVEHVESPFDIGKAQCHGLELFLLGKIVPILLFERFRRCRELERFGFKIQLLKLLVRNLEKGLEFGFV